MFDRIWGKLRGVKEGIEIPYPVGEVSVPQVRLVAESLHVNDFVICPNRREASRVYNMLKKWDCDAITRSVMWHGKPSIKVWRIR